MSELPQYWIGTSWKMNKLLSDALAFADGLRNAEVEAGSQIQRFVIPPFTVLRDVCARLADLDVKVGAQNVHWQNQGAWTGEVSAAMLADCGADMVEIGHSERRAHFGETDHTVGLKVKAALDNSLIPLICVGESLEDRQTNRTLKRLELQVRSALAYVEPSGRSEVLLAYEPEWAIGDSGEPATPEYIEASHCHIRAVARSLLDADVPCIYGGSVNLNNCASIFESECVDGLFIGRAAWDVEGYLNILAVCEKKL